jgi:hypothetical protein
MHWLKRKRSAKIAQGDAILVFIKANKALVGITDEAIAAFEAVLTAAKILLDKAMQTQDRTAVTTAQIKEAFDKYTLAIINLKRQYLTVPPLVDADLVTCQLRPADPSPTEIKPPNSSCTIKAKPVAPGVVQLDFDDYGNLSPEVRERYGVRYYWAVMRAETVVRMAKGDEPTIDEYKAAAGEEHYLIDVPKNGKILAHSQYTGRKRDYLRIENEEGNTLYLCARYETPTGNPGPWGPITRVIII